MKHLLLLLIVSSGLLLPSCAKNGVQTPTALSSYNMSAYANDELVTFNASAVNYNDSVIDIYGTWVTNINQTYIMQLLNLKVKNRKVIGTYSLDNVSEGNYYAYQTGTTPPPYTFNYNTTLGINGTVKIFSYDTVHNTISGTFNFTGYYTESNSTISINNGSFNSVHVTP
jgi:hypothetical protein